MNPQTPLGHFLLKGDPDRLRPPRIWDLPGERKRTPRIRCPACAWEPRKEDEWACECLHSWHTFDTFGVCPACDRKWAETQCLKCHTWSWHREWYDEDDDEDDDPSGRPRS